MILTNNAGLPEAIVRAATRDSYDRGECDYTTTQLIAPPRIVALRRQHEHELTEDVSEVIYRLMGQLGHLLLERAGGDAIVERRYFATLSGKRISGQIDMLDGVLVDYKFTSIWSTLDGAKDEWTQQANVNRWLLAENGVSVGRIEYIAIYRDWSARQAKFKRDYPQAQAQVFPIEAWPLERTREFVAERIALHEAAKDALPECSPAERWERPTKWAVMKKGRKTALKLHDNEREAQAHATAQGGYVELRPGESVRCADYCPVARFCEHGRAMVANDEVRHARSPDSGGATSVGGPDESRRSSER